MAWYCSISHASERIGDLVAAPGGVVVLTRLRRRRAVLVSGYQYRILTGAWPAPHVRFDEPETEHDLEKVVREARSRGEVALTNPRTQGVTTVVMSLRAYRSIAGESLRCTKAYAPMPRMMAWRKRRERIVSVAELLTLWLYWGMPACFVPVAYMIIGPLGLAGLAVAWVLAVTAFTALTATWAAYSKSYTTSVMLFWGAATAGVPCAAVAVTLWYAHQAAWAPLLSLVVGFVAGYTGFAVFFPVSAVIVLAAGKWS